MTPTRDSGVLTPFLPPPPDLRKAHSRNHPSNMSEPRVEPKLNRNSSERRPPPYRRYLRPRPSRIVDLAGAESLTGEI